MRKAVIDVGSNSVLLLVAEQQAGSWVPVLETSEVTALGEGTKSTGLLGEKGMGDTLAAIDRAFDAARRAGATSIDAAATMAARIATNTPDFLAMASAQGTPVTVLSGEDEAELGFRAVVDDESLLARDIASLRTGAYTPHPPTPSPSGMGRGSRISIIDVGGHSTELVMAERLDSWEVRFRRSFPIGTLGLRGGLLQSESPDGLALVRASKEIDDAIGPGFESGEAGTAVALGATGTNLVTIRERMADWQPDIVHGTWLGYEEISRAVGWLSSMTDAQRAAIVGIEKGRERTIHIGSLILERFLYAIRAEGCLVSVRGWRHARLQRTL